jgi:hypothetical protein
MGTAELPASALQPAFYSESEYYAAPVDELRTYPVYVKGREPSGYRDWIRARVRSR